MADRDSDGAERDAEETDELFSTDMNDNSCESGRDSPRLKLDQCDLLLDALDAQLGQLQIQPTKHLAISRERDCNDDADPLRWSHSMSKDTGLGSTTQTYDTPMSCLDLKQTKEPTSERGSGCREGPTIQKGDKRTRDKEEMESQREQVLWRLERLLGDTCNEGRMEADILPPSDSICTEDFVSRFRDEMVEWTFPESYIEKLDGEEVTERTEISDCQREHFILHVDRRGTALTGKSSENPESAHDCQSEEKCVYNTSSRRKAGAGERHSSPQRLGDDSSLSHRTEAVTGHETTQLNNSCSPKARCLAGVPVWSFDTVSIDSDLDSVCTEQVRNHIHRRPGWRSLLQSVTGMEDHCTNHSDTQGGSEPRSSSGRSFSYGKVHNRRPSVRKAPRNKRDSYRHVCSLDHNKKDTEEELNESSGRCRPERTSQKMHSDWAKMRERLSTLQQKCEKEEQTLQRKKMLLKDVELSLSELQQRRRHALQELERLTVETAKMEEEKRTLEVALRDSRAGKDAISVQMHELQRQREVCVLEVRHLEEELTALSQRKQTLKEGRFTDRPSSVVFSLLEREEMERQLDNAKTELFTEQRRAREKLESTQEKLEETCEELQRVTEAESLLRTRCAYLEEKQRQKKDQIEAVEFKVSEMRGDLGECKVRVSTQEKMLAQKELQLLDVQEQRGALQAERDGLKGALKHLKTQHCKASKEAHQQAQRMDAALKKEKKEMALAHEQQIQKLQEEEATKLRDSLETQQQEAQQRDEQQHQEALEKAHKTIEEERRKWEAESEEDLQMHCGKLQEQNRKSLESMRSEMQREKSKALALQQKVVELKTRVQEMERESCAQQREQESVTALMGQTLKEQHRAELQRMQRQMAQERQRAEKESDGLRVMLGERDSSHHQITAELQQRLRSWSQELGAETLHLQTLLEQGAEGQSSVLLPHSPTAAEARVNLRTLREQLKHLINHLQQELHSHKQTTEQLRKEKERELSVQRQQLRLDRDQALDSLKQRLIQEHIEELSWPHVCDGGGGGGGVAASLRKQLGAKDRELRQVQRSMAQWKERTAARLACKFEEELTSELERCKTKLLRGRKPSKSREERPTEPERPDGELALSAKEAQTPAGSPWLHAVDSAASHSPSDVASFKLLRFLQSRVKQLRVENQTYSWSPSPANTIPLDLSGSYLTTINQAQGVADNISH